jgi:hypothetical protein
MNVKKHYDPTAVELVDLKLFDFIYEQKYQEISK